MSTAGLRFRLETVGAVSSTADLLAARAGAGEPEGLAILAHTQTAGRGTQGRAWRSIAGNLHLSVLLRPGGALRDAPQWSLLAGVALHDALAPLLPEPRALALKWPNDLLLDGRKLAGILAEAEAAPGGRLAWISLGIGVNLAGAPALPDRPTAALATAGIVPPEPEAFAPALLERLAHWASVRTARGFEPIRAAWLARGPAQDAPIRVRAPDGQLAQGRFAGLAEDGSLLIAGAGRIRSVSAGEVSP